MRVPCAYVHRPIFARRRCNSCAGLPFGVCSGIMDGLDLVCSREAGHSGGPQGPAPEGEEETDGSASGLSPEPEAVDAGAPFARSTSTSSTSIALGDDGKGMGQDLKHDAGRRVF